MHRPPSANAAPQPCLLSPGQYVYPAPYSSASWSPHLRPFPDYSQYRGGGAIGRRSLNYRFGAIGALPSGSFNTGCGAFYGGWNGAYEGDVSAAYNQGRYDADREYLWYIAAERAGRLINQHAQKFDEGVTQFRDGHYEEALQNLLGAAAYDHSSAAPRLHAGHSMFALGRYAPAVEMLARAFELAPSLAYKTYDIRDEYGDKADFDRQLARLTQRVNSRPRDAAAAALLAYVTYYTHGPSAANALLLRARRLDPGSYFIEKLLAVSSAATADEEPSPEMGSSSRPDTPTPRPARTTAARVVRISRLDPSK